MPSSNVGKRSSAIGGAPIEPVTIKVTPLRPLFKVEDDEKCFRGSEFDLELIFIAHAHVLMMFLVSKHPNGSNSRLKSGNKLLSRK